MLSANMESIAEWAPVGVGESSASLGTRCLILFSATSYIHSKYCMECK